MPSEIIQIVTNSFTVFLALIAWVYNRELKKTDKNVSEVWLKLSAIDLENKNIKNNYISRFENLLDSQHASEIVILEGLSKLSYDIITKIDLNNKELKSEISASIDDKISSAISNCKLSELSRQNV